MKNLSYTWLAWFVLTGCQQTPTQQEGVQNDTMATQKAVIPQPASDSFPVEARSAPSMSTFPAVLDGNWFDAAYIEDLKKTHSPFASFQSLASRGEMSIHTSDSQGDSLSVSAAGIHEVLEFTIYDRLGMSPTSFPTNIIDDPGKGFYELAYVITDQDTSLELNFYGPDKNVLHQKIYHKAPENKAGALQYMVNKTLFAGRYKVIDHSGHSFQVELTSDGKLTGFPGFTKYYILTDFVVDIENNLDEICLNIQTPTQRCFAYLIKENTIELYTTKPDKESENLELNRLM